jgi:hypothetical protein
MVQQQLKLLIRQYYNALRKPPESSESGLLAQGVLLLHDNATPQSAHSTTTPAVHLLSTHHTALTWLSGTVSVFMKQKKHLQGQQFPSDDTFKA